MNVPTRSKDWRDRVSFVVIQPLFDAIENLFHLYHFPRSTRNTLGQASNTRKSSPDRMYHHSLTPGFCQRAAIEKDVSRFPADFREPCVVIIGVSLVKNRAKGMDESRNIIIWVTIGDRDSFLTVELAPSLAPRLQDAIVQGMVIKITDFRIFEEYFIWCVTQEAFHLS
jgi:hypothetical protein